MYAKDRIISKMLLWLLIKQTPPLWGILSLPRILIVQFARLIKLKTHINGARNRPTRPLPIPLQVYTWAGDIASLF
jgi:hypothetical protein